MERSGYAVSTKEINFWNFTLFTVYTTCALKPSCANYFDLHVSAARKVVRGRRRWRLRPARRWRTPIRVPAYTAVPATRPSVPATCAPVVSPAAGRRRTQQLPDGNVDGDRRRGLDGDDWRFALGDVRAPRRPKALLGDRLLEATMTTATKLISHKIFLKSN